ncbi:GTPase of the mitochondrial inner membrane that associates with the large ribosomal subunit [Rhizophlyctis rosea]|nr:GTPase of the mitochondrial inner membrane that associates with the large ribosomal subunit [Rhizophlyctis rosea]
MKLPLRVQLQTAVCCANGVFSTLAIDSIRFPISTLNFKQHQFSTVPAASSQDHYYSSWDDAGKSEPYYNAGKSEPYYDEEQPPIQVALRYKPSVHRKFLGKGRHPFVDFKRMKVVAGKGGDGGISFFHSSINPQGPPAGGNGGKGGDIYIVASEKVTSLNGIQNVYVGDHGRPGHGKQQHGSNGEDLEIVLPVGTTVRQVEPPTPKLQQTKSEDSDSQSQSGYENRAFPSVKEYNEKYMLSPRSEWSDDHWARIHKFFKFRSGYVPQDDRVKMLLERIALEPPSRPPPPLSVDLTHDGQRICIARGGRGGQGNPHFQSPEIRGPAFAGRGMPGPTLYLELELKTIADAGLVGLPNAGKSTFLAAVSNAHPRIAPYPFTTLNPYVGMIDFPDFWRMTLADIPGLIEGAHRNVGLGHRFLRHVERNKILVYVIDLAGPAPWRDLAVLKNELELYQPGLTDRPSLVVANKADLGDRARKNLEVLKDSTDDIVVPCSAKEGKNVQVVTGVMRQMVEEVRRKEKRWERAMEKEANMSRG